MDKKVNTVRHDSGRTYPNKAISLFQFIRELNKLKQKAVLNTKAYPWAYELSNLPDDPNNITMYFRDRVDDEEYHEDGEYDDTLLSVQKPEYQKCPEPNAAFADWLKPGWDNHRSEAEIIEHIEALGDERFTDNKKRVASYQKWLDYRSEWASKQKITEQTRNLFSDMYRLYFELQRESETEEIIVANGVLCDMNQPEICHPVLTRRVMMKYDADSNTVSIVDTNAPSELYSTVFQAISDVNLVGVSTLEEDLKDNDYHPLDRNYTPGFLKKLVHQLSSSSRFAERPIKPVKSTGDRLLLYLSPCFIVRKRLDGTVKAIEKIIKNIQQTNYVPKPIIDITSGGTIDIPEYPDEVSIEERLAAVGGESADLFFSKEANKEQLDIAKRIGQYNAVLVQGPPGTGKTHTIANLMGHFLAQGKSVLVTSYTKKALSVLKEKVAPGLQNLCVSMLDETNVDMERSIDGITSYTSKTTAYSAKKQMTRLAAEREEIIAELAEVRKKIFAVINQEYHCIVLNGEEISPSKAAAFVVEHADALSYIPGKVRLNSPLPLTFEQLSELYRSNGGVTSYDERELKTELPNPAGILTPSSFIAVWNRYQFSIKQLDDIQTKNSWVISRKNVDKRIRITGEFGKLTMPYPSRDSINNLRQYALSFGKIEKWMRAVAVDGRMENAFRKRWEVLVDSIYEACTSADKYMTLSLGKQLSIDDSITGAAIISTLEEMKSLFKGKGKISKLTLMLHKNYKAVIDSIRINGSHPASADDCVLVINYLKLQEARKRCSAVWDELLVPNGIPAFTELDRSYPERIARNWVPLIKKYLNWYSTEFPLLTKQLQAVGIPVDHLLRKDTLDSELETINRILTIVEHDIPQICDACIATIESETHCTSLETQRNHLTSGKRGSSSICRNLLRAMEEGSFTAYSEAYAALEKMYEKYELQKKRNSLLMLLKPIAPQWAEAIQTRKGIHGSCTVPADIELAWKWKQLCGIIEDITEKPFAELQADSLRLSREYREVTAKYAEKSGWYNLLKSIESNISMKQDLEGWRQTVKSIGKGTGRRAPMLRAKARELMAKCQNAVPGWIMPINKALECLDPCTNRFDVIIIDEASQSDISSLAILYMGKKLIIVGDDRQVSPMAVGVEDSRINALQEQYIKGIIPNYHLYTAKSSIYDVAKTTFPPLMLREHFRCVPDIIGFCNMLSYDGRILPLRDESSSVLLPAIVNYRVANGQRNETNKTNPKEAETIVALMQACFEQPEYKGKSFGVISLLGDEQAKLIRQEIVRKLESHDIIGRNVLCGNSANFQGDERDVVFLSLVDSGTGNGPLRLQEFGPDDAFRKRYNVAVSRARDQLWVVDSLDSANDLQSKDIRKKLIDYSLDPKAREITNLEIEKKAESPFEVSVATMLSNWGYHLVQQWKVGSYRLDIVAVCGQKKVAIECDGERWHSGEEKIREDMERQTILERLGWRFIRIRGSEFYRDSEKTIERVIAKLAEFGIGPENSKVYSNPNRETELLKRVKTRAASILATKSSTSPASDHATIAKALNTTVVLPDTGPYKPQKLSITIGEAAKSKNTVNSMGVESKPAKPETPKQTTRQDATASVKTSLKKVKCSGFVKELQDNGVEIVDNREQSGIVWVLFNADKMECVESILGKHSCKSSLEKRGAVATNNRPAWRVML